MTSLEKSRLPLVVAPNPKLGTRVRTIALGMLLMQIVWIFAVPPFRGSDEFDHTYRAAAVARGEWIAPAEAATRGTGAWLMVPSDVVQAAEAECLRLPYTSAADCNGTQDGDLTRVASGAGRYHPLFYALIGTPAIPFEGANAVYVMRLTGALTSWSFFVLALLAIRTYARSAWPYIGVVISSTPVLIYSSTIVAPNGLEMMTALALWAALIALARQESTRYDHRLVVIVTLAGTLLVTLRSLGPLWCGLILLSVLLAIPRRPGRIIQVLTKSHGWLACAFIGGATLASLDWIRKMGSLTIGLAPHEYSTGERLSQTFESLPLWGLQSIAAFPLRNQHAPPIVYLGIIVLGSALWIAAVRFARGRLLYILLVASFASFAVPAAITYKTLETYGAAWQGRYTLPFSIGVLLLASHALELSGLPVNRIAAWVGGSLFVASHAIAPLEVALREIDTSPGVGDGSWIMLPTPVLALLACMGAGLLWTGAAAFRDRIAVT